MFIRFQSKVFQVSASWLLVLLLAYPACEIVHSQEVENPVVESIRRNPPRTAVETARTILYLFRIKRWKEIGPFVDQVPKLGSDPNTSLLMVRAAGVETWLGLVAAESPLTDKQKKEVRALLDRASNAVTNDATLQKAIGNLKNPELIERKRAVLAIQAAGQTGLAALIHAAGRAEDSPIPKITSELVITFGNDGRNALKAAMSTNDLTSLAKFLELASRIPGSEYILELSAGLYIIDKQSSTYATIEKALSPNGQALPSSDSVARSLTSRIKAKIDEYSLTRTELTPAEQTFWMWRSSENRLESSNGVTADTHLAEAAQFASFLLRMRDKCSLAESALSTAVLLEQGYRESRLWMVEDPTKYINGMIEKPFDTPEFIQAVLDEAKHQDLVGAQLRAAQIAGKMLDRGIEDQTGLVSSLIRLTRESSPAVRYAAVASLESTLASNQKTSISQGIEQTRVEISKLDVRPLALVIGGNTALLDTLTSQLDAMEIRSETARNAREALRQIQEPLPIEMIFIVDRVADMSLSEFVQRLRAAPRIASLPIVMMASQWTSEQQRLLQSESVQGVFNATLTGNISFTSAVLRDVQMSMQSPTLDAIDRMTLRSLVEPLKN